MKSPKVSSLLPHEKCVECVKIIVLRVIPIVKVGFFWHIVGTLCFLPNAESMDKR
jgi:hypothetical protein